MGAVSMRALEGTQERNTEPRHDSGVRPVLEGYSRARYQIETRHAVVRARPAVARAALALEALPKRSEVDLFGEGPELVPRRTRRLSACPACPKDAAVVCGTCRGTGVVEAWLQIRSAKRFEVVVAGHGGVLERHARVSDPSDFEQPSGPSHLLQQAWFRGVPDHLPSTLRLALDPTRERVLWLLVQTFVDEPRAA